MLGIDVSKHQGSINWQKVKEAGTEFAIIRAGYGNTISQKDPQFEANYAGAKAQGLKVGAYWFNYYTSVDDAKKEAQAFAEAIKGKTFDLPLFSDHESDSRAYMQKQGVNPTAALIQQGMSAFLEELKSLTSHEVGIYSNLSDISTYFGKALVDKYPLWVASWGSNNGKQNTKPEGYSSLVCWQYTSKGSCTGITSSGLDMNVYYGEAKTVSAQAATPNTDIIYRVGVSGNKWYSEVKNYDENTGNVNGYAGLENNPIHCIMAKIPGGAIKCRVHTKGGKWLPWVTGYSTADSNNGYAGTFGKEIDAIQLDAPGKTVQYRVSVIGSTGYLPWVTNYDANTNNTNGYAGIYGKSIDKIQIRII